jgi:hypothetical protein
MEKIKNMNDLRFEKRRIRNNRINIESKIRENWDDLKNHLRPKNLVKESITPYLEGKNMQPDENDGVLKSIFIYGVAQLAKKVADIAEEKIKMFLRK